MDSLLAGAFCAIAVQDANLLRRIRPFIPIVLGVAAIGMFLIDYMGHEIWSRAFWTQSFGYSLLAFAYAAVVLSAYLHAGSRSVLDRVLTIRPLSWFGKYSYGIYVYHPFVLTAGYLWFGQSPWYGRWLKHSIVYSLGFILASLGVAWVSYHLFEVRFLNLKDRFRPVRVTEPDVNGRAATR